MNLWSLALSWGEIDQLLAVVYPTSIEIRLMVNYWFQCDKLGGISLWIPSLVVMTSVVLLSLLIQMQLDDLKLALFHLHHVNLLWIHKLVNSELNVMLDFV